MKKVDRRKNKAGFTLAEVLIVIAITGILAAFGIIGVTQYERRLRLMEADNIAKEIFLAAQNRLTASWARGEWDVVCEEKAGDSDYFGSADGDIAGWLTAEEKAGHSYYYLSNSHSGEENVLSDIILPFGSIDEKVRLYGTYIIDYDMATATIYDVYFVETDTAITEQDAKTVKNYVENDDRDSRIKYANEADNKNRNGGKGFYIGYYGRGQTPLPPEATFIAPEIYVHNEENLWLEVLDKNIAGYNDTVLTLSYKGVKSGTNVELQIPLTDNTSNGKALALQQAGIESSYYVRHNDVGGTRTYYILIDSLTTPYSGTAHDAYGHFYKHFGQLGFIPGEDVTVTAKLSSNSAKETEVSDPKTFNSLFAYADDLGNNKFDAWIANGRHLQNLAANYSGLNYKYNKNGKVNTLSKITLINDIYWRSYATAEKRGYFDKVQSCPSAIANGGTDIFENWKNRTTYWYRNDSNKNVDSNGYFWPINSEFEKSDNGGIYSGLMNVSLNIDGRDANGVNHVIYNLNMRTENDDVGLIGKIKYCKTAIDIRNITLIDPGSRNKEKNFAGTLIGKIHDSNNVEITNCHSYMSSESTYRNGTFNINEDKLNALLPGAVSSIPGMYGVYNDKHAAGGLIGDIEGTNNVTITGCSASVPVYVKYVKANGNDKSHGAGGFIGMIRNTNNNLVVRDCYSGGYTETENGNVDYHTTSVNVSGDSEDVRVGGFVGSVMSNVTITNCYTTSSTYSDKNAGGFVGYISSDNSNTKITNSYAVGRVFGKVSNAQNDRLKYSAFYGSQDSRVSSYHTNNYYFDYTKYAGVDLPSGVEFARTDYHVNAVTPATGKELSAAGTSSKLVYNADLRSLDYPFKTVNSSGFRFDHIGDWPSPQPIERTFDGDFGIIYYERVQIQNNNKNNVATYYHGFIANTEQPETTYQEVKTTDTLTSPGNMDDHGLKKDGDNYVVEDGYLILVAKNVNIDTFGYGLYDTTSIRNANNGSKLRKYDAVLHDLNIAGYDAYFINPLNREINNFVLNGGAGITCKKDVGYNNWQVFATIYCNPYFADEISLSPLGTNHYVRSAHGLRMLFDHSITGGRYISNNYSGHDTVKQTMDINFDRDMVTFTTCDLITGNRVEYTECYQSPTLWYGSNGNRSLVGTYDGGGKYIRHLTAPFVGDNVGTLKNLKLRDIQAPFAILSNSGGTIDSVTVYNAKLYDDGSTYAKVAKNYGFLGGDNTGKLNKNTISNAMIEGSSVCVNNSGEIHEFKIYNVQIGGNGFIKGSNTNKITNSQIYSDIGAYNSYRSTFADNRENYHPNPNTVNDFDPKYGDSLFGYNLVTIGLNIDGDKNSASSNTFGFANSSNWNNSYIQNCSVTGKIYGKSLAAGFINELADSTVKNCYSNALIYTDSGTSIGFANKVLSGGVIDTCNSIGILEGKDSIGFVSTTLNESNGEVKNCYSAVWKVNSINHYPFTAGYYNKLTNNYYLSIVSSKGEGTNDDNTVKPLTISELSDGTDRNIGTYNRGTTAYNQFFVNRTGYPYPLGNTIRFYGDWADNAVNVRFDCNGNGAKLGSYNGATYDKEVVDIIMEPGQSLGTLPVPTWIRNNNNYEFLGWFTERDPMTNNKISDGTLASETVYYAHWALKVAEYKKPNGSQEDKWKSPSNALYKIETWGAGKDGKRGSYAAGTIYWPSGWNMLYTVGKDGEATYVSAEKDNRIDKSLDKKKALAIMLAAGSEQGYYSPDDSVVSYISGDGTSNAISYLAKEGDLLFTGQSVNVSGNVFGNSTHEYVPKPEDSGTDNNTGYIKISRLVMNRDDNDGGRYSDGRHGGDVYELLKPNNYVKLHLYADDIYVAKDQMVTIDQIKNSGVFKAEVETILKIKSDKSFELGEYTSKYINNVIPNNVTLSSKAKDVYYQIVEDGATFYQFIEPGTFGKEETNGYNVWDYRTSDRNQGYVTVDDNYHFNITIDGNMITEFTVDPTKIEQSVNDPSVTITATGKTLSDPTVHVLNNNELIWESSDANVASVENGIISFVGPGTATITVKTKQSINNDPSKTQTINVKVNSNVSAIKIERDGEIPEGGDYIGSTATLKLRVSYTNQADKILSGEELSAVSWSVSDPNAITISSDGVATFNKYGTYTVSATYMGVSTRSESEDISFNVDTIKPLEIKIIRKDSKQTDYVGYEAQLTLLVTWDHGNPTELSYNQLRGVEWEVRKLNGEIDSTAISISSSGVATLNKTGSYTVSAKYLDVSTRADHDENYTFTDIQNVSVQSIKVIRTDTAPAKVYTGDEAMLGLEITYNYGPKTIIQSGDLENTVRFEVRDSSGNVSDDVRITYYGKATFNKAGDYSIYATYSNISTQEDGKLSVRVVDPKIVSIKVNREDDASGKDYTTDIVPLSLELTWDSGKVTKLTGTELNDVVWTVAKADGTADTEAISIADGKATLNKAGSYVISAQYKDVSTTADDQKLDLTVEENQIKSITISTKSGKTNVYTEESDEIVVTAHLSNGTEKVLDERELSNVEWTYTSEEEGVDIHSLIKDNGNGKIDFLTTGSISVKAKYNDFESDVLKLVINQNALMEIEFENDELTLKAKTFPQEFDALIVNGVYKSGNKKAITDNLKWNSSDTSVLSVDESGKLNATKEGSSILSVEYKKDDSDTGFSCEATITVAQEGLTIKVKDKIKVGETAYVTLEYPEGTPFNLGGKLTVTSSNESIAKVDIWDRPVIVGASPGKATITYTVKNESWIEPELRGKSFSVEVEIVSANSLSIGQNSLMSVPLALNSNLMMVNNMALLDNLIKPIYSLDTDNMTVYEGQKDVSLPVIWKFTDGERDRVDVDSLQWTSDNNDVLTYEDGKLSINGTGEATLSTTIDDQEISIYVEVVDNPGITDFNTQGDNYMLLNLKTRKWVTEMPEGLIEDSVNVKGGRIVEDCGSYYYLTQDFSAKWDELTGDVGRYTHEKGEDGSYLAVRLPVSEFLDEDDFNEDGTAKFELRPGDVFYSEGKAYTLINDEVDALRPDLDDDGWALLDDYVPGADTGPESDGLYYPDSEFNPYPGNLNNNCTWAAWYLANEATGVRLPAWGDAGNWFRRASISGYATGQTPAKNSIIVFDRHVAFVSDVSEDGTMLYIKEGNIQKRYIEGWWQLSSSRYGMDLYGFIYLGEVEEEETESDTVESEEVIIETVTLEAGRHDEEATFIEYLESLGLVPGERSEAYDDQIEEGYVVTYKDGELALDSSVDYTVSLGKAPEKITITQEDLNVSEEEFKTFLEEKGLIPGEVSEAESELEKGTVIAVEKEEYQIGDTVNYTVSKGKDTDTPPSESDTDVTTQDPADPSNPGEEIPPDSQGGETEQTGQSETENYGQNTGTDPSDPTTQNEGSEEKDPVVTGDTPVTDQPSEDTGGAVPSGGEETKKEDEEINTTPDTGGSEAPEEAPSPPEPPQPEPEPEVVQEPVVEEIASSENTE